MLSKSQVILICLYLFKRLRAQYPQLEELSLTEVKKLAEVEVEYYLAQHKED
jgi:hypothetical protein